MVHLSPVERMYNYMIVIILMLKCGLLQKILMILIV